MRSLCGNTSPTQHNPPLLDGTEPVCDAKLKCDVLGATFAAVSESENYPRNIWQNITELEKEIMPTLELDYQCTDDPINAPFTISELRTALISR